MELRSTMRVLTLGYTLPVQVLPPLANPGKPHGKQFQKAEKLSFGLFHENANRN
jgi:hypothetical protein